MADFRKYAVTVAGLACLLGVAGSASAQTLAGFSCNATATPFDMRAEGITEQAGDIVLTCTGGTVTPLNGTIPSVDITVSLNTNITSRLLAGSTNLTDALILINEPLPNTQSFCPASGSNANTCLETGFGTGGANQQTFLSAGFGGINQTYNPNAPSPPGLVLAPGTSGARYNGVQGTLVSPSQVTFFGVPVDPPGQPAANFVGQGSAIPALTLRITNIRANASALGAPTGFSASSVFATVSTSAGFPVNNSAPTVGFVRRGLTAPVVGNVNVSTALGSSSVVSSVLGSTSVFNTNPAGSFQQCVSRALSATSFAPVAETLTFSEGFATATKLRSPGNLTTVAALTPLGVPGAVFNTESQFIPQGPQPFDPSVTAGLATYSTRIRVSFGAIPTGVTIYVPNTIFANQTANGNPTEILTLTSVSSDTASAGSTVTASSASNLPSSQAFSTVTITGGAGIAVYEVTSQQPVSPTTVESFTMPILATYTAQTGATPPSPSLGTSTISVDFAPQSTVITASSGPIPRFVQSNTPVTGFSINPCSTVLLFPFLSNLAGFDTGLAISNTSLDPFGTPPQTGTCTLNFYGTAAPATSAPTAAIAPGTVLPALLSNLAPGFQGYLIVRCGFQYGHGFAFITDGFNGPGRGLSQGYLALIIPDPSANQGTRGPSNANFAPQNSGEGLTN